jgi:tRNA-specific 2-thiouridylase
MGEKKEKIFVAMSGGVDSSVAAALLRDQGYDVTGVYFKTYKPDGDTTHCRAQGLDAQKVCEGLGIPFKVFDLQEEYKQKVFEYMLTEYRAGRTPNPDIMCNKHIKFGAFLERALQEGADTIATGHYARVARKFSIFNFQFSNFLLKGVDENKDQSYFLSQLSKEQLEHVIFPLGKLIKPEVRALARKYNLHTAEKKESQGLCFIGHEVPMKDFLKNHIPETAGNTLNTKGEVVGSHNGSVFYTIGERHGFTVDPKHQTPDMPRMFVIEKNIKENTITIGTEEELGEKQHSLTRLTLTNSHWINKPPHEGKKYTCRIRHRGELYPCKVTGNTIHFLESPFAPAAGQFVAVYKKEYCLGGGTIA